MWPLWLVGYRRSVGAEGKKSRYPTDARTYARLREYVPDMSINATACRSANTIDHPFEIVAGDLADSVRRDESQLGGAKKRQYKVFGKYVRRLLWPYGKGFPSPIETVSLQVNG